MSSLDVTIPATPIAAAFTRARGEHRTALIPYVMAGYPDLPTSEALAVALCEAGADLLELGVPFSHPPPDGATIQHPPQAAPRRRMTPSAQPHLSLRHCELLCPGRPAAGRWPDRARPAARGSRATAICRRGAQHRADLPRHAHQHRRAHRPGRTDG